MLSQLKDVFTPGVGPLSTTLSYLQFANDRFAKQTQERCPLKAPELSVVQEKVADEIISRVFESRAKLTG